MKKIVDKPLGQILIENKMITPKHLEEALKAQQQKGGLIGQVLVSLGYTNEEAIAQALTTQYGVPYLPLAGFEIDREIAKLIPEKISREHGLVAVDKVGSILTIGMSDPLNSQVIESIEELTKLRIQIYVCTSTDVHDALSRLYAKAV